MKFASIALVIVSASLLAGCDKTGGNASDQKPDKDQLAEEKQQQILSALHEREAALDERDRLLNEREKSLNLATPTPPPAIAAQPVEADQGATQPDSSAPQAAAPDVSYQQFYDALAPYGNWMEMKGYGYVWQPNATVQDYKWRPYTMGNFVYTDEGWTWVSDEPFGWATYHYGRWMRTHALGWVWTPGDIWAPAWVSWRYGNDYVGWAPLPPEATFNPATGIQQWADQQYSLGPDDYTFVPAAAFGDASMAADAAPPDEVVDIYDDSNNETNIYYDTASYVVICYGPNYDFMRSKARHGLPPPYKINRAGFIAGGKNGTVVAGNTLHVTAPRIFGTRVPPAPHFVRGTVADFRLVAPQSPPILASRPQGQVTGPQSFQSFAQPTNPSNGAPSRQALRGGTDVPGLADALGDGRRGQNGASAADANGPQVNAPPGRILRNDQNVQQNQPAQPNPAAGEDLARQQEIVRQQQTQRENEAARQIEEQRRQQSVQNEQIRQAQDAQAQQQRDADRAARDQENTARQEIQRAQEAQAQQREVQQAQQSQQRSAPVQSMPAGGPAGSPGGFPGR